MYFVCKILFCTKYFVLIFEILLQNYFVFKMLLKSILHSTVPNSHILHVVERLFLKLDLKLFLFTQAFTEC